MRVSLFNPHNFLFSIIKVCVCIKSHSYEYIKIQLFNENIFFINNDLYNIPLFSHTVIATFSDPNYESYVSYITYVT